MIYGKPNQVSVPELDILTFLFDSEHGHSSEHTALHADALDPLRVITKARARSLTRQMAHFLRHRFGIGAVTPGSDVVVTISTGQCALACLFFAVIAAEGVYSAASPAATSGELARQIHDGPATVLVCSADLTAVAREAARIVGLPEDRVLVLRSAPDVSLERLPDDSAGATSGGAPSQDRSSALRCRFSPDEELAWQPITDPDVLRDRTACMLYSSGTTGLPKGVLISHMNVVSEVYIAGTLSRPVMDEWRRQGRGFVMRTLAHLPTAHIAGVMGYFINPIYSGAIVYWMPRFHLETFVRHAAELGITFFFSVPPVFSALAKHPGVQDQFRTVQHPTCGAAPLSRDLQEAASAKMAPGINVTQAWGLTETTGAVSYSPLGRNDTMGSLSPLLPNVTLRLVDDNDQDVRPGDAGEALVKGPMITRGYHNNPEANRNGFTSDGWFRTGDLIRIENDLLYLVDRKKELIKYKGNQVAPAELEGILTSHVAVADAAVIGVPFQGTEAPRAYVALSPRAPPDVSEASITHFVKTRVANHKQLRGGVVFIDAVPRSPAGKILRRELRERYQREMQAPQSRL